MKFSEKLRREIARVDADLRGTPWLVIVFISCLAAFLAATYTFGGLHL